MADESDLEYSTTPDATPPPGKAASGRPLRSRLLRDRPTIAPAATGDDPEVSDYQLKKAVREDAQPQSIPGVTPSKRFDPDRSFHARFLENPYTRELFADQIESQTKEDAAWEKLQRERQKDEEARQKKVAADQAEMRDSQLEAERDRHNALMKLESARSDREFIDDPDKPGWLRPVLSDQEWQAKVRSEQSEKKIADQKKRESELRAELNARQSAITGTKTGSTWTETSENKFREERDEAIKSWANRRRQELDAARKEKSEVDGSGWFGTGLFAKEKQTEAAAEAQREYDRLIGVIQNPSSASKSDLEGALPQELRQRQAELDQARAARDSDQKIDQEERRWSLLEKALLDGNATQEEVAKALETGVVPDKFLDPKPAPSGSQPAPTTTAPSGSQPAPTTTAPESSAIKPRQIQYNEDGTVDVSDVIRDRAPMTSWNRTVDREAYRQEAVEVYEGIEKIDQGMSALEEEIKLESDALDDLVTEYQGKPGSTQELDARREEVKTRREKVKELVARAKVLNEERNSQVEAYGDKSRELQTLGVADQVIASEKRREKPVTKSEVEYRKLPSPESFKEESRRQVETAKAKAKAAYEAAAPPISGARVATPMSPSAAAAIDQANKELAAAQVEASFYEAASETLGAKRTRRVIVDGKPKGWVETKPSPNGLNNIQVLVVEEDALQDVALTWSGKIQVIKNTDKIREAITSTQGDDSPAARALRNKAQAELVDAMGGAQSRYDRDQQIQPEQWDRLGQAIEQVNSKIAESMEESGAMKFVEQRVAGDISEEEAQTGYNKALANAQEKHYEERRSVINDLTEMRDAAQRGGGDLNRVIGLYQKIGVPLVSVPKSQEYLDSFLEKNVQDRAVRSGDYIDAIKEYRLEYGDQPYYNSVGVDDLAMKAGVMASMEDSIRRRLAEHYFSRKESRESYTGLGTTVSVADKRDFDIDPLTEEEQRFLDQEMEIALANSGDIWGMITDLPGRYLMGIIQGMGPVRGIAEGTHVVTQALLGNEGIYKDAQVPMDGLLEAAQEIGILGADAERLGITGDQELTPYQYIDLLEMQQNDKRLDEATQDRIALELENMKFIIGNDLKNNMLVRMTQKWDEALRTHLVNPKYDERFWSQLTTGAGSLTQFAIGGRTALKDMGNLKKGLDTATGVARGRKMALLAASGGKNSSGWAATAMLGSALNTSEGVAYAQEWLANNPNISADDVGYRDTLLVLAHSLVGASEVVPIERAIKMADLAKVPPTTKRALMQLLVGSASEGVQEGLMSAMNRVAQEAILADTDPQQAIEGELGKYDLTIKEFLATTGASKETGMGAILGGIMEAIATGAAVKKYRRIRGHMNERRQRAVDSTAVQFELLQGEYAAETITAFMPDGSPLPSPEEIQAGHDIVGSAEEAASTIDTKITLLERQLEAAGARFGWAAQETVEAEEALIDAIASKGTYAAIQLAGGVQAARETKKGIETAQADAAQSKKQMEDHLAEAQAGPPPTPGAGLPASMSQQQQQTWVPVKMGQAKQAEKVSLEAQAAEVRYVQAQAAAKIGQGRESALTEAERQSLEGATFESTLGNEAVVVEPAVADVAGVSIVTDKTIGWMKENAPSASRLIRMSESEATSRAGDGTLGVMPTPDAAPEMTEEGQRQRQRQQIDQAQRQRNMEQRQRDLAEAQIDPTVGQLPNFQPDRLASDSPVATPAERKLRAQAPMSVREASELTAQSASNLSEDERKNIAQAALDTAALAIRSAGGSFSTINFDQRYPLAVNSESGRLVMNPSALASMAINAVAQGTSVQDALSEIRHMVRHEQAHVGIAQVATREELAEIWEALPQEMRETVLQAYFNRAYNEAAKRLQIDPEQVTPRDFALGGGGVDPNLRSKHFDQANDSAYMAQEYFRMLIQSARDGVVDEAIAPPTKQLLKKILDILERLVEKLTGDLDRLSKTDPELHARVTQVRDDAIAAIELLEEFGIEQIMTAGFGETLETLQSSSDREINTPRERIALAEQEGIIVLVASRYRNTNVFPGDLIDAARIGVLEASQKDLPADQWIKFAVTAANNRVLKLLRSIRRNDLPYNSVRSFDYKNDSLGERLASASLAPDEAVARAEGEKLLQEAVDALPTKQREVTQKIMEGMSAREIGREIGVSHTAVNKILGAASEKLRFMLDRADMVRSERENRHSVSDADMNIAADYLDLQESASREAISFDEVLDNKRMGAPNREREGPGLWMVSNGDVIPVPNKETHGGVAAKIIGVSSPYEGKKEAAKAGWVRINLVEAYKEIYAEGRLNSRQRRNLNDFAAFHKFQVNETAGDYQAAASRDPDYIEPSFGVDLRAVWGEGENQLIWKESKDGATVELLTREAPGVTGGEILAWLRDRVPAELPINVAKVFPSTEGFWAKAKERGLVTDYELGSDFFPGEQRQIQNAALRGEMEELRTHWADSHPLTKAEDGVPKSWFRGHFEKDGDIFRARSRINGFLGGGDAIYFTDSVHDASKNYADPTSGERRALVDDIAEDLQNRIDDGEEFTLKGVTYDSEKMDGMQWSESVDILNQIAINQLSDGAQIAPVYLKMKNPAILDPQDGASQLWEINEREADDVHIDDAVNELLEEYRAERTDALANGEERDARTWLSEEYPEEVANRAQDIMRQTEAEEDVYSGNAHAFIKGMADFLRYGDPDIVWQVASDRDQVINQLTDQIYEISEYGPMQLDDLLVRLFGDHYLPWSPVKFGIKPKSPAVAADYPGELVKEGLKAAGYDGILMDASYYFPSMDAVSEVRTKHAIIWDVDTTYGMFGGLARKRKDPLQWASSRADDFEDVQPQASNKQASLVKMIVSKIYEQDMGGVIVREMVQNSLDAIRPLIESGDSPADHRIKMIIDKGGRQIEMTDTGHGMLPNIVQTALINVTESFKQTAGSGGYGVAKAAIFGTSGGFEVETVARASDGSLTKTTMTGDGEAWFATVDNDPDKSKWVKISVERNYRAEEGPTEAVRQDISSYQGDIILPGFKMTLVDDGVSKWMYLPIESSGPSQVPAIADLSDDQTRKMQERLVRQYDDYVQDGDNDRARVVRMFFESEYGNTPNAIKQELEKTSRPLQPGEVASSWWGSAVYNAKGPIDEFNTAKFIEEDVDYLLKRTPYADRVRMGKENLAKLSDEERESLLRFKSSREISEGMTWYTWDVNVDGFTFARGVSGWSLEDAAAHLPVVMADASLYHTRLLGHESVKKFIGDAVFPYQSPTIEASKTETYTRIRSKIQDDVEFGFWKADEVFQKAGEFDLHGIAYDVSMNTSEFDWEAYDKGSTPSFTRPQNKKLVQLSGFETDRGFYKAYSSPNAISGRGSIPVMVLNRGLYQFGYDLKLESNDIQMPEYIAIDVDPKVDPVDSKYPFTLNRDNLVSSERNQLAKYVTDKYIEDARRAKNEMMRNRWAAAPVLATLKSESEKRELKILDLNGANSKITNKLAAHPGAQRMSRAANRVAEEIMAHLAETGWESAEKGRFMGFNIGSESTYGVNVSTHHHIGNQGARNRGFFVDPINTQVEMVKDKSEERGLNQYPDLPSQMAASLWTTIAHEINHNDGAGDWSATFSYNLTDHFPRLAPMINDHITQFGDELRQIYEETDLEEFIDGLYAEQDFSAENVFKELVADSGIGRGRSARAPGRANDQIAPSKRLEERGGRDQVSGRSLGSPQIIPESLQGYQEAASRSTGDRSDPSSLTDAVSLVGYQEAAMARQGVELKYGAGDRPVTLLMRGNFVQDFRSLSEATRVAKAFAVAVDLEPGDIVKKLGDERMFRVATSGSAQMELTPLGTDETVDAWTDEVYEMQVQEASARREIEQAAEDYVSGRDIPTRSIADKFAQARAAYQKYAQLRARWDRAKAKPAAERNKQEVPLARLGAGELYDSPLLKITDEERDMIRQKGLADIYRDMGLVQQPAFNPPQKPHGQGTKNDWVEGLSEEERDQMGEALAYEAMQALTQDGNALGWYDRTMKRAIREAKKVFPELSNKRDQAVFKAILAITSNGQVVKDQFGYAYKVFDQWLASDRKTLPSNGNWGGERTEAINTHFALLSDIIEKWGLAGAQKFLDGYFEVGTINKFGKKTWDIRSEPTEKNPQGKPKNLIEGEASNAVVQGSMIFGPKLGNFYANMSGDFSAVTMDRWFMRTFGRVRGDLISLEESNKELKAAEYLRSVAKKNGMIPPKGKEEFSKWVTAQVRANDKRYIEAREQGLPAPKSTTLSKALKRFLTVSGLKDAPSGPGERREIRRVMRVVQAKLQKSGILLNNADLQAILWYYEKDLVESFGGPKRGEAADYAVAASQLAETFKRTSKRLGPGGGSLTAGARREILSLEIAPERLEGRTIELGMPLEGEPNPLETETGLQESASRIDDFKTNSSILNEIVKRSRDGFTLNPQGSFAESGYVVAASKSTEAFVDSDFTDDDLRSYLSTHAQMFELPGSHLGGWFDIETSRFVLDVSFPVKSRTDAIEIAIAAEQDAIYHIDSKETIRLRNEEQPTEEAIPFLESSRSRFSDPSVLPRSASEAAIRDPGPVRYQGNEGDEGVPGERELVGAGVDAGATQESAARNELPLEKFGDDPWYNEKFSLSRSQIGFDAINAAGLPGMDAFMANRELAFHIGTIISRTIMPLAGAENTANKVKENRAGATRGGYISPLVEAGERVAQGREIWADRMADVVASLPEIDRPSAKTGRLEDPFTGVKQAFPGGTKQNDLGEAVWAAWSVARDLLGYDAAETRRGKHSSLSRDYLNLLEVADHETDVPISKKRADQLSQLTYNEDFMSMRERDEQTELELRGAEMLGEGTITEVDGGLVYRPKDIQEAASRETAYEDGKIKVKRFGRDEYRAYVGRRYAGGVIIFGKDWDPRGRVVYKSFVEPDFRRQGVATALYTAAEQQMGEKLVPSTALSDDAFRFWMKFRPESFAPKELRRIGDELIGQRVKSPEDDGAEGTIQSASGVGEQGYLTLKFDKPIDDRGSTMAAIRAGTVRDQLPALDAFLQADVSDQVIDDDANRRIQEASDRFEDYDYTEEQMREALPSNKQDKLGGARDLEPGTTVTARLDIPSVKRGVFNQTIHKGMIGTVLGYDKAVRMENVTMAVREKEAAKIKGGANKSPMAGVKGGFVPGTELPGDIETWTALRFNPHVHAYFFTEEGEIPVVSADEAFVVGAKVYVRGNIETADPDGFQYASWRDGELESPDGYPIETEAREMAGLVGDGDKVVFDDVTFYRQNDGRWTDGPTGQIDIAFDNDAQLYETMVLADFDPEEAATIAYGDRPRDAQEIGSREDPDDYGEFLSGDAEKDAEKILNDLDDPQEFDAWLQGMRERYGQEEGEYTKGVPRLANPGQDPQTRAAISISQYVYDQERKRERFDDWAQAGEDLANRDPEGVKREILAAAYEKRGLGGPEMTIAAKIVTARAMRDATRTGSDEDLRQAVALAKARQLTRSEVAREMAAGRDTRRSPEERHAEMIADFLVIPERARSRQKRVGVELDRLRNQTRKQELLRSIAEAKTPEDANRFRGELDRLQDDLDAAKRDAETQQKRINKLEKALGNFGVTLRDVFDNKAVKEARENPAVEKALATFQGKDRKIAEMLLKRMPSKRIQKQNKVARETVEKVYAELRVQLAKKYDVSGTQMMAERSATTDADQFVDALLPPLEVIDQNRWAGNNFDMADPAQAGFIARVISTFMSGSVSNAVHEFWINSILSGPMTQAINVFSNTLSVAYDGTVQRGVEAIVNQLLPAVGRQKGTRGEAAQVGDLPRLWGGFLRGMAPGLNNARKAWSTEMDFFESEALSAPAERTFDEGKVESHQPSIPDRVFGIGTIGGRDIASAAVMKLLGKGGRGVSVGATVRIPGRALGFADSFYKTVIGHGEVAVQAYRIAKAEVKAGQLKPDQMEDRIAELMEYGSVAWEFAVEKAKELTFTNSFDPENGNFEKMMFHLQRLKSGKANASESALLKLLVSFYFPFLRTPTRIFQMGLRKTPIGTLNLLIKMGQAGIAQFTEDGKVTTNSLYGQRGRAELVRDLAEQIIAWTVWPFLYEIAEGDDDDEDKQLLVIGSRPFMQGEHGERKLSDRLYGGSTIIRVGGRDGTHLDYGRYEPISTVLTTVIDMIRAHKSHKQHQDTAKSMSQMWGYFVNHIQGKTFLSGIDNLNATIEKMQTQSGRERLIKEGPINFLQGFVPNLFRQPARNLDELPREYKSGNIYKLTGLGRYGIQKVDLYGRPVEKSMQDVPQPLRGITRLLVRTPLEADELHPGDQFMSRIVAFHPNLADKLPTPYGSGLTNKFKGPDGEYQDMDPAQRAAFQKLSGELFSMKVYSWEDGIRGAGSAQQAEDDLDDFKKLLSDARREAKDTLFKEGFYIGN